MTCRASSGRRRETEDNKQDRSSRRARDSPELDRGRDERSGRQRHAPPSPAVASRPRHTGPAAAALAVPSRIRTSGCLAPGCTAIGPSVSEGERPSVGGGILLRHVRFGAGMPRPQRPGRRRRMRGRPGHESERLTDATGNGSRLKQRCACSA